eukprot:197848-Prymnesium_polylepis.1
MMLQAVLLRSLVCLAARSPPARLCHGAASDVAALQALTVPVLKARLRASGLRVCGRKAELIDRLLSADTAVESVDRLLSADTAVESVDRLLSADTAVESGLPASPSPSPRRRAQSTAAAAAAAIVERDPTPRRAAPPGAETLRVASWNVAGLRGLLNKRADGVESLRRLLRDERADVLMLQETKLQPHHVAEAEVALFSALALDGAEWGAGWACSSARK